MENSDGQIKSARTLFGIIECLHKKRKTGVTELAEELNLSKSAVHKHLKTMESYGYVKNEAGQYSLHFLFLTYGGTVRDTSLICRAAEHEISNLKETTDELISFGVRNGEYSIYTHIKNDSYRLRNFVPLGTRMYLHQTAVGKAVLSNCSTSEIDSLFHDELPSKTENTIQRRETLHSELQEIRKNGFAISDEESLEGVISIAASVENDSQTGAISISLPAKDRSSEEVEEQFARTVVDAASRIELRARYSNKETSQTPL